jgi:hypothetical protein
MNDQKSARLPESGTAAPPPIPPPIPPLPPPIPPPIPVGHVGSQGPIASGLKGKLVQGPLAVLLVGLGGILLLSCLVVGGVLLLSSRGHRAGDDQRGPSQARPQESSPHETGPQKVSVQWGSLPEYYDISNVQFVPRKGNRNAYLSFVAKYKKPRPPSYQTPFGPRPRMAETFADLNRIWEADLYDAEGNWLDDQLIFWFVASGKQVAYATSLGETYRGLVYLKYPQTAEVVIDVQ